jgi:hypothetical protein
LKKRIFAEQLYLILAAMFIAALVGSNLIFQKFFHWDFFGWRTFELSVGILPYPITFLITDIISEIYGARRANRVVFAGIAASFFMTAIVYAADIMPAAEWSPVDDGTFNTVFGLSIVAVTASMLAYLAAQFIDIQIFHFWKRLTSGRMLWLRNNFSTFFSQFVDTALVLILLCSFKVLEWQRFPQLLLDGFLFKILIAALDTPLIYIATHFIRKKLGLKFGQEYRSSVG